MSRRERNTALNSKMHLIIIAIIVIAIIVGIVVGVTKAKGDNPKTNNEADNNQPQETQEPPEEVETFKGTDRPIAVMIDNNVNAQPQAGINDAYIVYEIIVEGGESRLMMLFKNAKPERIGPVRSSRHYFLDYVMENDALYTHYGCSYVAEKQIPELSINNIDGMVESEKTFWRDSTRKAPHNALTTIDKILAVANRKGYRTTSEQSSVLKYTAQEVNLENGTDAKDVKIPYSSFNTVEYKYNSETKRYTRYSKGKKQTDWNTGKDATTKNIIITFARNYDIGDTLQELENIEKLKGYYITNGKAIEITCEKADRKSKTIYKDLQGKEIKVNDGNTFIQICPLNANVTLNAN